GAGLVPVIAVAVPDVGVPGEVPAVHHVVALPLVREVAAAGGPLDGQAADRPVRHRLPVVADHGRLVAGHGHAGRAGPDGIVGGGDEDVQHLGGADPVDDLYAGGAVEVLPHRRGQMLAGRDAPPPAG